MQRVGCWQLVPRKNRAAEVVENSKDSFQASGLGDDVALHLEHSTKSMHTYYSSDGIDIIDPNAEEDEGRAARVGNAMARPPAEELEEHNMARVPHRSLCESCVVGRERKVDVEWMIPMMTMIWMMISML